MHSLVVPTTRKTELVDITEIVQDAVRADGFDDGILALFCPHTTAGITLNENWDPDVQTDVLLTVDERIAPPDPRHRHGEGNSPAHVKTSLFGSSQVVLVEGGKLLLGQWQGIYLAEFDGPRRRKVWLKFIGG
ncbi:secondary thiamine-phosphate synthase enzyme YjbQ [Aggregatilinea lenta]|uniref:secondary thiamine-phosphate synthase enzyme YjbQ n=1 Tax=Aggregatilinea lenta TaxID=913108 RepID=UPI000E5C450B|nr:secondary thiamine-phosphate synthase enzyme YjbQ [Aggregatilinea lenta]